MLILPAHVQMKRHNDAKEGLKNHFNSQLEKILSENSDKNLYWILGKAKVEQKKGKDIIRPFLQACAEKPGLIKDTFVYEVDSRRGVKTLLWLMQGDVLTFPTLGKSVRLANGKGANKILVP